MEGKNTLADVGGVLEQAEQKPCLVGAIRAAFAATGPAELEKALVQVAERVQDLEKALGA